MMKKGESSSGSKPDRKTIEKNRRTRMRGLCIKLVSLIPATHFNPPKELLSQPDQLEQAASYIQLLRERVEELRRRKTRALMGIDPTIDASSSGTITGGLEPPILKITDLGPNLEVVLISGLRKKFMLHQVIAILEQEGANVAAVALSNNGDRILHTLHAQVKVARVGVDTSRISERIVELIS